MQMNDSQRIPASQRQGLGRAQRSRSAQAMHSRMSKPGDVLADRNDRHGGLQGRTGEGDVRRQGDAVRSGSAEQLSYFRRRLRRRGRVCQGRCRGASGIRNVPTSRSCTTKSTPRSAASWRNSAQRLIDSTARKLAAEFFASFGEVVGGEAAAPAEAEAGRKSWIGRLTGTA